MMDDTHEKANLRLVLGQSPVSPWQLVSRPSGSVLGDADISGGTTAAASFTADVSGPYVFKLTVRDGGLGDSVTLPEMTLGVLHDTDPID